MKKEMIFAGLTARPVRTTVTILAVALEVILILVIIGLTTGITDETAKRTEGVGAELLVQPSGAGVILALSENSMSIKLADKLREFQGVKAVAPVMIKFNTEGGIEVFYGIDSSFTQVTGGFHFHDGTIFKAPYEVVVDDLWAASKAAKVGDTVDMLNHPFKIAGIVEHGQGARVFMSMQDLSDRTGQTPKAGAFFVKLNDPAQIKTVKAEIEKVFENYTIRDVKDYETLMTSANIPGLGAFINAVVIIALCVGIMVIFLSMYTTITERTREIGILRSMGASKAFIVGMIFQETTVVCILGVVVGTIASSVITRVLSAIFPTLIIEITNEWRFNAAAFAILSGIIGSFYPSVKAAGQDPVEALAYE
ncbi:MAG TPA: ABC transporter permease [Terriglobia bacterium]|jgi:putative ABC transport system permease protein